MANKTKILNQVQKYITKGQWDKAIRELQKLVAEDPKDVRTLLKLGDVYSKQGDRESATRVYRQVAESYGEQGFFLKAVAVYKQILKHDPHHLEVTLRLAELYEQLNLTSEALAQYQHASAIHEEVGDAKSALEVLRRMVDLDPQNVASRIKLAEGFSREKLVHDAAQEFERAASILKEQNRLEDYIKVAERLLFHDASRLDVVKNVARLLLARGETKRALAKLQVLYKENNRDVETLTLLARAFSDLGQNQKTVFVHRELARVHQEEGRPVEAAGVYQQILTVDPNDEEARRALGASAGPRGPAPISSPPTPSSVPSASPTSGIGPSSAPPPPPPPSNPEPPVVAPSLAPRPMAPSLSPRPAPPPAAPSADLPDEDIGLTLGSADLSPVSGLDAGLEAPPAPASGTGGPELGPAEQIQKILTETDVFVRYGLRDKALDHLAKVFDIDPHHVGALEKRRDVHLAAGDEAAAADAVATIVQVFASRGEKERMEQWRSELAQLMPNHPLAGTAEAPDQGADIPSEDISIDIADEGPSFDISTSQMALQDGEELDPFAGSAIEEEADPFAGGVVEEEVRPASEPSAFSLSADLVVPDLPSSSPAEEIPAAAFEVEAPTGPALEDSEGPVVMLEDLEADIGDWSNAMPFLADSGFDEVPTDSSLIKPDLGGSEPLDEADAFVEAEVPEPSPPPVPEAADTGEPTDYDDELEEAAFMVEAGLLEEAREILAPIQAELPEHPRVSGLWAQAQEQAEPSTPPGAKAPEPEAKAESPRRDSSVTADLARRVAHMVDADGGPSPSEDAFDQGMMYRELGRLDEAIEAFRSSARVQTRAIASLEMIGHCLVDQGETKAGIECFKLALHRGAEGPASTNLKYEVGVCYERLHDLHRAADWYAACAEDDPEHRDVSTRLGQVRGNEQANGEAAPRGPTSSRRNKISYL
ncbi:MAG: tetratricopeptide repeat protein [Myxococcota bacterium]